MTRVLTQGVRLYRGICFHVIRRSGFESRQGLGSFFATASRPTLGPTQPPTLSPGVNQPGLEA